MDNVMDVYDEVYRGKVDILVTSVGIPLLICYTGNPWDISDDEAESQCRRLQELGILPETTQKQHLCAGTDAHSTPAALKSRVVHTLNPCSKVESEPGSVSKCPAADTSATGGSVLKLPTVDLNGEASQVLVRNLNPGEDSSATGGKAEVEVGSVSMCPAADSSATRIGGSVLKRPRVDLDEASQVLVGDMSPGHNLSTTGGKAKVEVGSVSKCPTADNSSATRIGGSVLKRPRVDLDEASQVLVGDMSPGHDSSATGTIEGVKGGSVLNKDLGWSSEIVSIF